MINKSGLLRTVASLGIFNVFILAFMERFIQVAKGTQ
jgi:hypothetical protein